MARLTSLSIALAATLFAATGALAATATTTPLQPFENQQLAERGESGLDRHQCRTMEQRNLKLPAFCNFRY